MRIRNRAFFSFTRVPKSRGPSVKVSEIPRMCQGGREGGIGFFLAAPPLFLRFFRDFATPGAAFFKRGVALEEGGSQKGGPHFFLRGAAF